MILLFRIVSVLALVLLVGLVIGRWNNPEGIHGQTVWMFVFVNVFCLGINALLSKK